MAVNEHIVRFIDASPQRSIFCTPWWLEAVAGNRYRYLTAQKGESIEAVMPIVETKRFGFRLCTMPPYTQTLGILLAPMSGKYATRLAAEHRLFEELIQKLPKCHYTSFRLHPTVSNWLPFHWHGFQQTTRYTYLLPDISQPDTIWQEMRSNIRREIRKARNRVTVTHDSDVELLIDLQQKTFNRQGQKHAIEPAVIRAIHAACSQRDQGKLFFAKDDSGKTHSGLLLVWDDRTAYYLIGGSDPELRTSGAHSLLMWEAIQFASTKVKEFNFEGSMLRSIERFFRGFGAVQVPFFEVHRLGSKVLRLIDCLR
ncbi:MAG: GNAT family N-acetyltransferase [bacterium]